jgi:hypothetical protein
MRVRKKQFEMVWSYHRPPMMWLSRLLRSTQEQGRHVHPLLVRKGQLFVVERRGEPGQLQEGVG